LSFENGNQFMNIPKNLKTVLTKSVSKYFYLS
jgi:hypothetical protein